MGAADGLRTVTGAMQRILRPGRVRFVHDDVVIGRGVRFGRNVEIRSRRVRIGDEVHIGDDVRIDSGTFEIGDYGTIYRGSFFPGPGDLVIGHNFWLGTGSIVDSKGGTTIGNNVGVGAQSQLWTHMIYGDVMAGCRFHTAKPLRIGDDAWLVGHCLVSPVTIGERALILLGSVLTRDVPPDRTFGGVPAADVTERFGPQFNLTAREERERYMRERLQAFAQKNRIRDVERHLAIVGSAEELRQAPPDVTAFDVVSRTYTKRATRLEVKFMRFLLPEAKFVPL
jgi:acetyltransferase-like isoleucine patch superfamily enzyme